MRKIFLDCGTNLGQGFEEFIKRGKITSDTEVHCFEPNPYCEIDVESLRKISSVYKITPDINFHSAAVLDKESNENIVVEKNHPKNKANQGVCISKLGTISTEYILARGGEDVLIRTISLSKFIENLNLKDEDELRIKLDIEGSEFLVLEDMLNNEVSLMKVKELWVEWHERLFPNRRELEDKRKILTEKIRSLGVSLLDWY